MPVFHSDFPNIQISAAEFTCPPWLSFSAMKLITQILDPNPMTVSYYALLSLPGCVSRLDIKVCVHGIGRGARDFFTLCGDGK